MLAVCLHWPERWLLPRGVSLRETETWRLAPRLAGCWPGLSSGVSQGWSPEDMAFRTELESPMVDRYVVPISETISFNNFIHCQHRSKSGSQGGCHLSGWL